MSFHFDPLERAYSNRCVFDENESEFLNFQTKTH